MVLESILTSVFRYCEKEQNLKIYLTYFCNHLVTTQLSGRFFQIFVAFSKYLDLTFINILLVEQFLQGITVSENK